MIVGKAFAADAGCGQAGDPDLRPGDGNFAGLEIAWEDAMVITAGYTRVESLICLIASCG